MPAAVRYLVFDIESVADAPLVAKLRYAGQALEPAEAVRRYRAELMEKYESDFIPYTFPGADLGGGGQGDGRFPPGRRGGAGRAAVPPARDHRELLAGLGEVSPAHAGQLQRPGFRPAAAGAGRLPLWAERARLVPGRGKSSDQPRSRYNTAAHIDLCELLTNFGSTRFNGGLNLAANLLGKPGKMDVQGDMVQDLYDAGRLAEINDYCRCDVLDTYFVFLRTRVLLGQLTLETPSSRSWPRRRPGWSRRPTRWPPIAATSIAGATGPARGSDRLIAQPAPAPEPICREMSLPRTISLTEKRLGLL